MTRDKDEEVDLSEDGMEPTEEVGPDGCEAHPDRCQFKPPSDVVTADECDFESDEEIFESFPVESIPTVIAEDGLPEVIVGDPEDAEAVPFTYDTQLCVEDDREWVEVFSDEMSHVQWQDLSSVDMMERRFKHASKVSRMVFKPSEVSRRLGYRFAERGGKVYAVRPKRERCRFYKRQVLSFKGNPGRQKVYRICTARRSNGGAYMSLGDEGIFCCDLRDPCDEESSLAQDEKDRVKLLDRPDLVRVPVWGEAGEEVDVDE